MKVKDLIAIPGNASVLRLDTLLYFLKATPEQRELLEVLACEDGLYVYDEFVHPQHPQPRGEQQPNKYERHENALRRMHRAAYLRNRGVKIDDIQSDLGVARSTAFRLLKDARAAGLLNETNKADQT